MLSSLSLRIPLMGRGHAQTAMLDVKRCLMPVCLASLGLAVAHPGSVVAQGKGQDATAQRFLDALAERRQNVTSAKFELSGRIVYPAQSLQNRRVPGQYYPARDETSDLHEVTLLDFDRNRFRQDYRGPELFVDETGVGSVSMMRRIHTFDGIDLYTLSPRTEQNQRLYRDAPPDQYEAVKWDVEKTNKKMLQSVFFTRSYPMLFACGRLPLPGKNYHIGDRPEYTAADFQFRGLVVTGGLRCAVLRWARPPVTDADYLEWHVDSQSFGRIVRYQQVSDRRVRYDLEIQYTPDSRTPTNWVFREYDSDNPRRAHKLTRETQCRVRSAEINHAISDADFSPDFRPGMLVHTPEGVLPVAADGQSLVRPFSLFRFGKYVLAGVVIVAACVAFVLLWRARGGRRRTGGTPSPPERLGG